jgi:solute carrier family 25 carnitine/acylcarnitine transporter 20/29
MSADFWAGYVSGAVGIIIGNPLDLVKTRLQAGSSAPEPAATASTAATPRGFRGQFENAGMLVRGAFGACFLRRCACVEMVHGLIVHA